jgi:hypothetical protein
MVNGDTGNGATLTLALFDGTTAITAALDVINITPSAITAAKVDASTLATTGHRESIPGDLADSGDNTATFKWMTGADQPQLPSAAGTCTITFPLRSGETTPAAHTGSGFLTSFTPPALENGVLQVGTLAWQWDGDTGPSFTKSAST